MAAAGKRSGFAIIVSIIVVVAVVGVGALVVWMNNQASAPAEAPAAGVVNEETGGISIGDGPDTVAEYIDFMCPHCKSAHSAYSDTFTDLVTNGDITLEIHPISILDRSSQGTEFSTRSAAAVYCVAEDNGDAVYPFVDLMFRNAPAQATEGLTDEEIIGYAEEAGATGAAQCITDGEYHEFVAERTPETPIAPGASGISTPTIVINDEVIQPTLDPEVDLIANLG